MVHLSLIEQVGKGVPVERVLETRADPENPYRLPDDAKLASFSFVVAYDLDCAGGICLTAVKLFGSARDAEGLLRAKARQGINASMFSVLPDHLRV